MNAAPHFHAPVRADADVEIDRLHRCMVNATDPTVQANYCRRFTAAVNARNALRSPQEIEELEAQRGLR